MSSENVDIMIFASLWILTLFFLVLIMLTWNQETKDVCEYLCSTYYTNTEDYKKCKEKPLTEIVKNLPREKNATNI